MVTACASFARRATGISRSDRARSLAFADSIPARCLASNRRARPAAVVEGSGGSAESSVAATSTRCRSSATSASPRNNWDCAMATSTCPALTPRSRRLIGPIPRSKVPTTSSRSTNSANAATPEVAVSEGSGAPIRTRFRRCLPRRTLFTDKVLLPLG